MKVVYEAGNVIDAHLVRHALEHAGIPAFVRGEALLGGMGELPVCGMVAVCVPAMCWPDACHVLEGLPLLVGNVLADEHPRDARDARDAAAAAPSDADPWPVAAI